MNGPTYRKLYAVLAVMILFSLSPRVTYAEPDGNGWRELSELTRVGYLRGVLDVMTNLHFFSRKIAGDDGLAKYFEDQPALGFYASSGCDNVKSLPLKQALAITEKYLNDHPDLWHLPMSWIVASAFSPLCKR